MKDESLLSFINLFESKVRRFFSHQSFILYFYYLYQVWVYVTIFVLIIWAILKILIKNSGNSNKYCNNVSMDFIRLFFGQDVDFPRFSKTIGQAKFKFSIIILMKMLIFFSFILTKSFTSLLLNTYFITIQEPVVESLEQLINGNLLLASHEISIIYLDYFEVFDPKHMKILKEKKQKYDNSTKIFIERPGTLFNKKIFNDMVDGKVIILQDSYRIDSYLDVYKKHRERFIVTEHKYCHSHMMHFIQKDSFIKKQQVFGFVYASPLMSILTLIFKINYT